MQTIPILNLNPNYNIIKDGEAIYANNVIVTRDLKAVRNENGFDRLFTFTSKIHGKIVIPDGYVLFMTNPDKIVFIKNDVIIKTISSNYFNFNIDHPITGNYDYNSDGDIIVTFTEGIDGNNETRIINITKSSETLSITDVQKLDLIPNVIYPTMEFTVSNGGSMKVGSYQIAITYKVDNGLYTNYSIYSIPIHVNSKINEHVKIGDITNRSILINLSGLDTRYEKYKFAILYADDGETELVYETEDIEISNITYRISSFNGLKSSSIESTTIPSISYIKDNAQTNFMNRLYRGNVQTIDYTGIDYVMQNIANSTNILVSMRDAIPSTDTDSSIIKVHFKEGEHYAFYIGAIDYKGNFVNAYPIPWKASDQTNQSSTGNHIIPYYGIVPSIKMVPNIKAKLPNNISSLLDNFNSIIKSFVFFYAEHDLNNSKILGQGFAIRDFTKNDFNDNQTYIGPFASLTKVRFYSFEHLFNQSNLSNCSLYKSRKLYGFVSDDKVYNSFGYYCKTFDAIPTSDSINVAVNKIKYINNDNAAQDNIAGESYHRITLSENTANSIFGGSAHIDSQYGDWELDTDTGVDDTNKVKRNRMAFADLISNSNRFFSELYNQKLVTASSIIPSNYTSEIQLYGDFFYDNFTFRITGPVNNYKYGTNNVDESSEDRVYKIIISIPLESRYNIKGRYSLNNTYQTVYTVSDKTTDNDEIHSLLNIPYKYDNFINTSEGKGYHTHLNYNGYNYNDYVKELEVKFHYPYRVIRSNVMAEDQRSIPWSKYLADEYKDMKINRGGITAIESDELTIYIQQQYSLSIAFIRDKISVDNVNETYLGSSDIFDRIPYEVLYDKTGYICSTSRFHSIITTFGYFVVDAVKSNIYLIKRTNVKKLDTESVKYFFNANLNPNLSNPYKKNGLCLLYDDYIKSVFLTQQINDSGFTIHYHFETDAWISFHSYIPDGYLSNVSNSYCIKNNTIYRRHANNKCIFFKGTQEESSVIYLSNIYPNIQKLWNAVSWHSFIRDNNLITYNITFDHIVVFNDNQCSGIIQLPHDAEWFDKQGYSFVNDTYFVDSFKDCVKNDRLPFRDKDYNLIDSNIDVSSEWFTKSNFISKYLAIKFVYNNDYIDTNTGNRVKTPTNGYKQLEIVLIDFDVNVAKNIRQ